MTAYWTTGEHHGLAWRSGFALVDGGAAGGVDTDAANRLWERVRAVEELGDFLTALSEVLGSGLLGLPAFAVSVSAPDGVHIAARGRLLAAVDVDGGQQVRVSGNGVATWTERHVRRATAVTLLVEGDPTRTPAPGPTSGRVLVAGVVPAAAMTGPVPAGVAPTREPSTVAQPTPRPGSARVSPDFISFVPGASGTVPPVAAPAPPPHRPASVAPVPTPPASPEARTTDHDGRTVARVPDRAGPEPGTKESTSAPGGPSTSVPAGHVLAVHCAAGHANPPQRPGCRVCNGALSARPMRVPRPSLGRVVMGPGEVVELVAPLVLGRAPRANRFRGTEAPRLVTLAHPHISSSHLALWMEDWNVLAVDLGSTNGTFLRRNGQPPVRLSDRPHLLVPGDVVDLGHGVHLRFEELP